MSCLITSNNATINFNQYIQLERSDSDDDKISSTIEDNVEELERITKELR